jgi:hypothetical protein
VSPTSKNRRGLARRRSATTAPATWETSPATAAVGLPEQRHRFVGGGSDAGLDLLEVGAAVLEVAEARLRVLLIAGLEVAVEADRGHVQYSCDTFTPNVATAAAPTEPVTCSNTGPPNRNYASNRSLVSAMNLYPLS